MPDAETLLACKAPDAAIVSTANIVAMPNNTHLPLARPFMEQGILVLVEKPIAGAMEEAETLIALSVLTGVSVVVGINRRRNPIFRAARDSEWRA